MGNRVPHHILLKISLHGKSSWRLFFAAILSFSFSIAVILSTFGLMDGFEKTLKLGLLKSNGEISITSREGFFSDSMANQLLSKDYLLASVLQSEGFALFESISKGVLIKGIEPKEFSSVTGVGADLKANEVVLGKELALQMGVEVGDYITLTFAKGDNAYSGLPTLERFRVAGIVDHEIYEKNLRFVYMLRSRLAQTLTIKNKVNLILLKRKNSRIDIEQSVNEVEHILGLGHRVRPYWYEFSGLLEAVEVEKLSITLILQLIVVIGIFNIAAFVIFISERKSQDFFLLRVLGTGVNSLQRFWVKNMLMIWFFSCLVSIGFTQLFDWLIRNLDVFKLPGKIYVLEEIGVSLELTDYILVFGLALVWIMIMTIIAGSRVKAKSLLSGLRKEFQ